MNQTWWVRGEKTAMRPSIKILWPQVQFSNVVYAVLSVYDTSGAASDRNSVVLNDIHIDIMDYIVPATCTDTEFRQMWAEFEWENKVAVNTNISDLHEYLDHIIRCTNMKCLTPEKVHWLAAAFFTMLNCSMPLPFDSLGEGSMFSGCLSTTFVHSSGQILPRYLMNSLNSLSETYREYSLAATDDLFGFCRSRSQEAIEVPSTLMLWS